MKIKSVTESTESYVRNSAKSFLEGMKNLAWIAGVLEHSGLTRDRTGEILRPLAHYGDRTRAQELFSWLTSAIW